MYLSRLYIENFRTIDKIDIALKPGKNVLVGKNGVGKTNILKALELAFERDFSFNLINRLSQREFDQFVTIDNESIVALEYINNDQNAVFDLDILFGTSVHSVKRNEILPDNNMGLDTFNHVISAFKQNIVSANYSSSEIDKFKSPNYTKLQPKLASKSIMRFIFCISFKNSIFRRDFQLMIYIYDINEEIESYAVDPRAYRPLNYRYVDFKQNSKDLIIGLIKNDLDIACHIQNEYLSTQNQVETALGAFEELINKLFNNSDNNESNQIHIQSSTDGKILIELAKYIKILSNNNLPIEHESAGNQVIQVIQFLRKHFQSLRASQKTGKENEIYKYFDLFPEILALEEPEQNLHPHARRQINHMLNEMVAEGKSGAMPQLIMSTHSTEFIEYTDKSEGINIIRVVKDENGRTQANTVELDEKTNKKLLQNSEAAEMFFADFVILVEGFSDKVVLERLASIYGSEKGIKPYWLDQHNVSVINVDGKKSIINFISTLKQLEIQYIALVDFDYWFDEIKKFANIELSKNQKFKCIIENIKKKIFNPIVEAKKESIKYKLSCFPDNEQVKIKPIIEKLKNEHKLFILEGDLEDFVKYEEFPNIERNDKTELALKLGKKLKDCQTIDEVKKYIDPAPFFELYDHVHAAIQPSKGL